MSRSEAKALNAPDIAESAENTELLDRIAQADPAQLQRILAVAIRSYGERYDSGPFLIFPPDHQVTSTDVMVAATEMLEAVELQTFELGMWQAWSDKG